MSSDATAPDGRPQRRGPEPGQGPGPSAARDEPGWRRAAVRTGLRAADFSADALGLPAGGAARAHLAAAERHLLAGRDDDADRELQLAADAAGHGPAGQAARGAIFGLRGRVSEATAADRHGTPIRQFDRVLFPVGRRQEAGVVEWVAGGNGLGGRTALVYAEGCHLWPGHSQGVPYADLAVAGRGADPVTAGAAVPYAAWLPPGVSPGRADRGALATAIRRGLFATGGATRAAVAYHRANHQDAAAAPMARCPSSRCQAARLDWLNWAAQFPGPVPAPSPTPRPPRPAGRTARPPAAGARPARRVTP